MKSTQKPLPKFPVVEVEWADTAGHDGWWEEIEAQEIMSRHPTHWHYLSSGYLIHKDKDAVWICVSIGQLKSGAMQYGDITRFPASQVRKLTVIRGIDVNDSNL